MKEVVLSDGTVVAVFPVPPFALTAIERSLPANTPEGVLAREKLVREAAWLIALPGVKVPKEWKFPYGLSYAGIQPREGDNGAVLDYIEYGLLKTPSDIQAVQSVMYEATITEDEIGVAEDLFQGDGGRQTFSEDPA